MWIVRLVLRFVVIAILILIVGIMAIVRTPMDIFPTSTSDCRHHLEL
jgi:Cu/Ag efflux pump CusA